MVCFGDGCGCRCGAGWVGACLTTLWALFLCVLICLYDGCARFMLLVLYYVFFVVAGG